MQLQVLMLNQDDPKKCTAAKLVKFNLANKIIKTSKNSLVLDPYAKKTVLPSDRKITNSLTAIDCSWNKAETTFFKNFLGIKRKLPPLFAGNPINYSKLGKLTSVEALSGTLFIFGNDILANNLLDKFKWGHTFFDLNKNLLRDYSRIKSEDEISLILKEYEIVE